MKKDKIKVYLIDDHALILEGLKKLVELEDDIVICGSSIDPSRAIREIERANPDVAVVDISLKDMNGIDLVKTIKGRFPTVKSLVLSMHDENVYAERALKSGALGYVMKHAASDAVVDAIRTVARGEVYLSEQMKKKLLGRIAKHPVDRGILPEECLSDRELEIFQMIGEGLPTREVAKRLGVSAKTVEAHREHIKEKLDIRSASELVLHAIKWVTGSVR